MEMLVSIIVPVLDDAAVLHSLLNELQVMRAQGHEVIVVDGGSSDDVFQVCNRRVDQCISAPAGRARQMNAGAAIARGELFWFLHADSLPAAGCLNEISGLIPSKKAWGRFDVQLSGEDPRLRIIEFMMNLRSRLTGIATGDQGIFITRDAFNKVNGYKEIPLMEDIEISKALKKISPPLLAAKLITTSSRRWEKQGIIRTVLLMWALRLAYAVGFSAERLSVFYRTCSTPVLKS